ncbi:hypothetical protein P8452_51905 [Trifolium repens]|nr:hypothetical protein P8452_51905 [Trifolium repens]
MNYVTCSLKILAPPLDQSKHQTTITEHTTVQSRRVFCLALAIRHKMFVSKRIQFRSQMALKMKRLKRKGMLEKIMEYAASHNVQRLEINSQIDHISAFSPHTNIHKVILCTPKVTSLTVNGIIPAFPAPSTCNLTLLEELKFDCPHGKFTMGEDIYISWLHLLAIVERLTLNILFLESMVNVLKNNGSTTAQLPSFVKLKSLKVESCSHTCDESVREMVTYLLQKFSTTFNLPYQ